MRALIGWQSTKRASTLLIHVLAVGRRTMTLAGAALFTVMDHASRRHVYRARQTAARRLVLRGSPRRGRSGEAHTAARRERRAAHRNDPEDVARREALMLATKQNKATKQKTTRSNKPQERFKFEHNCLAI